MDSLKETDKPATNLPKHPRIEVDEELMRQMIAGQAPLDSKVVRRIPEPEEENTDAPEGNTSAPTAEKTNVDTQTTTVKEPAGFRRKKIILPDFERTFRCRICFLSWEQLSGKYSDSGRQELGFDLRV